jgi:hypothetical protein
VTEDPLAGPVEGPPAAGEPARRVGISAPTAAGLAGLLAAVLLARRSLPR